MQSLLMMNINTKLLRPHVIKANMKQIANHFQFPRNSIGIGPKNAVVHEKPTGASFICPVRGFSK